jgi:hypothetical protein
MKDVTTTMLRLAMALAVLGLVGCEALGDDALERAAAFVGPIEPVRLVQSMPEIDARGGQDPLPRATVPDSRLRLVIGLKLDDAELAIDELSYSVKDQRVTLRGKAEAMIQRDRAELIVRSVEGVRGVDNRIEVGR